VSPVEGSGTFTETTSETVVNEGTFEDVAEGIFDGHTGFGSVGRDFDFFGLLGDIVTFYTGVSSWERRVGKYGQTWFFIFSQSSTGYTFVS